MRVGLYVDKESVQVVPEIKWYLGRPHNRVVLQHKSMVQYLSKFKLEAVHDFHLENATAA